MSFQDWLQIWQGLDKRHELRQTINNKNLTKQYKRVNLIKTIKFSSKFNSTKKKGLI